MLDLIRIFASVFVAAAFIVVGVQLFRGEWTSLVFSMAAPFESRKLSKEQTALARARNAGPVSISAGAAVLFLLLYGVLAQLGQLAVAQVCSILCDVAMVAFIVFTIRLYIKLGVAEDKKAKFRSSNVRVSLFVLVHVAIIMALAVLF